MGEIALATARAVTNAAKGANMIDLKLEIPARVLIVDDDDNLRDLVSAGLEAFGCVCREAESVAKAREALAREALAREPFDIVMLDVAMPGETGDVLLKELAPKAPETVVIMMTAESDIETAVSFLRDGAYDFLSKPFSLAYLRQIVGQAQKRRRLEIENREYRIGLEDLVEQQTAAFKVTMQDLLRTRQALIQGLCGLAEFRDDETGRHLERMSEYTVLLARRLAAKSQYAKVLTPAFIESLHEAAPLHDIGKVGIPDRILLKAGKLTSDEYEEMKRHTRIGADSVRLVINRVGESSGQLLRIAAEICEHHHERWDGGGYPDGLSSEAIPIAARIATLADFYDATTFPRVYRPYAIPHEEVKRMVLEARGTIFCPDVVDAFLEVEAEALVIKKRMSE